jgi:predicted transcriptional regulator
VQREERLTKIEGSRLPYTTLASTLKNLQKKGYLSGRLLGNAYLYKATITEDEYKKGLVSALVGDYFGDSYERLVHFCVEEKKLSVRALKELIEQIETEG